MAKAPSLETQLRTARSEFKRADSERYQALNTARLNELRATKAEAECAEWKKRFDALLKVVGDKKGGSHV